MTCGSHDLIHAIARSDADAAVAVAIERTGTNNLRDADFDL